MEVADNNQATKVKIRKAKVEPGWYCPACNLVYLDTADVERDAGHDKQHQSVWVKFQPRETLEPPRRF